MEYDVPLIPQTTVYSCWVASMAMILSWRDGATYDSASIARNAGGLSYLPMLENGLSASDQYILTRNGFQVDAPRCYTWPIFKGLLDEHGPLWVAYKMSAPFDRGVRAHVLVVTGYSEEEEGGARLRVNDPSPMNQGATTNLYFDRLIYGQERLAMDEMHESRPVYVAWLRK